MTKESFGLIGVGAFGALAGRHLAPYFDLVLHDTAANLELLAREIGAQCGSLKEAASCDIVMLAVPVQKMRPVLTDIAPLLRPTALVIDVASVKIKPVAAMCELLPANVSIVGTHPLFGPQSGKNGVIGLNIAVCEVRGGRSPDVVDFCSGKLGLRVTETTPENHDREAAYVQGLTHMITRIVTALDLPPMHLTTRTYELMQQMVEMLRYDSDELFRAIERENPYAEEAKRSFFAAARKLEEKLSGS
jgi:prephenate dehydrogenase